MKKLSIFLLLLLFGINTGKSAGIISNFDIATWYLNADLVVVCSVENSDTVLFDQIEKLLSDTSKETYNLVQERYDIVIHAILKNESLEKPLESIYTQEYVSDYCKKTFFDPILKMKTETGEIYEGRVNYNIRRDSHEHYRLKKGEQFIVILNKVKNEYQTVFQTDYNEKNLELFKKIDKKGNSYFAYLKKSASKGNFENLFPECTPQECPDILKTPNTHPLR